MLGTWEYVCGLCMTFDSACHLCMHACASVLCDDAVHMQCIYTCVLIIKSGLKRGRREPGLALLEELFAWHEPGQIPSKRKKKNK